MSSHSEEGGLIVRLANGSSRILKKKQTPSVIFTAKYHEYAEIHAEHKEDWNQSITCNLVNKELHREAEELGKLREGLEDFVNHRPMAALLVSAPLSSCTDYTKIKLRKTTCRSCGTFPLLSNATSPQRRGRGFIVKQEEAGRDRWKYNTEILLIFLPIYSDQNCVADTERSIITEPQKTLGNLADLKRSELVVRMI